MVERIRDLLESRQLTPTQFADIIGVARPIVSHILSGRNKPSLEVVQRILVAMPDLAMPWLLNGTGPMLASATSMLMVPPETVSAAAPAVSTAPSPVPVVADEPAQTTVPTTSETPHAPVSNIQSTEQELISNAPLPTAPPRASTPARGRNWVAPKRFIANAAPLDALPLVPDTIQAPPPTPALDAELPPATVLGHDTTPDSSTSPPTPMVEAPATTAPLQPIPAPATPGDALASALFAGCDKPIRRIVVFYRDGSFADYQPE